jgi:hypothetical protein
MPLRLPDKLPAIEAVDQCLHYTFEQTEVVDHVALVESVGAQQDFDFVAVSVNGILAAVAAAVANHMGTFELE